MKGCSQGRARAAHVPGVRCCRASGIDRDGEKIPELQLLKVARSAEAITRLGCHHILLRSRYQRLVQTVFYPPHTNLSVALAPSFQWPEDSGHRMTSSHRKASRNGRPRAGKKYNPHYQCPYCTKTYLKERFMLRHLQKKHHGRLMPELETCMVVPFEMQQEIVHLRWSVAEGLQRLTVTPQTSLACWPPMCYWCHPPRCFTDMRVLQEHVCCYHWTTLAPLGNLIEDPSQAASPVAASAQPRREDVPMLPEASHSLATASGSSAHWNHDSNPEADIALGRSASPERVNVTSLGFTSPALSVMSIFRCHDCNGKTFGSEAGYQSHLKGSKKHRPFFQCPVCAFKTRGVVKKLSRHFKKMHPGQTLYNPIACLVVRVPLPPPPPPPPHLHVRQEMVHSPWSGAINGLQQLAMHTPSPNEALLGGLSRCDRCFPPSYFTDIRLLREHVSCYHWPTLAHAENLVEDPSAFQAASSVAQAVEAPLRREDVLMLSEASHSRAPASGSSAPAHWDNATDSSAEADIALGGSVSPEWVNVTSGLTSPALSVISLMSDPSQLVGTSLGGHTALATPTTTVDIAPLCRLCLDDSTNPVTATCGHVFCHGCVVVEMSKPETMRCPACSSPIVHVKLGFGRLVT